MKGRSEAVKRSGWPAWVALALLAVSTGCAETETPALDVESAELVTPQGSYPLEATAIREICWGWPIVIAGGSDLIRVEFTALAPCPLLRIGKPVTVVYPHDGSTRQVVGRLFGIELVSDASYYRLNDDPPEPLELLTRPSDTPEYPPTF